MIRPIALLFSALTVLCAVPPSNSGPLPPTVRCDSDHICVRGNERFSCTPRYACCRDQRDQPQARLLRSPYLQCCQGSGELFNPATEVCVNRTIRAKQDNEEMCGWNTVYQTNIEDCCRTTDNIGKVYRKAPHGKCCNGFYLTMPNQDCCNSQAYDKSIQTCCNQPDAPQKLWNQSYGECCQERAYDPVTHECRDGEGIRPKANATTRQCFGVAYNWKTHGCCNNVIHMLSESVCYRNHIQVPKLASHHTEACKLSDGTYETFSPNASSDGTLQVCIPGEEIRLLQPNEDLCSSMTYNTEDGLCCGGKLHKKGRKQGKKCCENATKVYNSKKQTCCRNQVGDDFAEDYGGRCCEAKAYNSSTHKCNAERRVVMDCEKVRLHSVKGMVQTGVMAYTAIITRRENMTDNMATWSLTNARQLKGGRKLKMVSVRGELKVTTNVTKCFEEPEVGQQYLILSKKKLKSSPKKRNRSRRTRQKEAPAPFFFPVSNDAEVARTMRVLLGATIQ